MKDKQPTIAIAFALMIAVMTIGQSPLRQSPPSSDAASSTNIAITFSAPPSNLPPGFIWMTGQPPESASAPVTTLGEPSTSTSITIPSSPLSFTVRGAAPWNLPPDLEAVGSAVDPDCGLPLCARSRATGLRFRLIAPGAFTMGAADGDEDEKSPHEVTLSYPYYIGVTLLSNEQWEQFRPRESAERGYYSRANNQPAAKLSWYDAQAYLRWLCEKENAPVGSYRLPTEAEHEKAARGGLSAEESKYPWGNTLTGVDIGIYNEDAAVAVDAGPTNRFGLFHPTANVLGWCMDWYGDYPADTNAWFNPIGPARGKKKVMRGGTWFIYNQSFRCADRWKTSPGTVSDLIGLRVVRALGATLEGDAYASVMSGEGGGAAGGGSTAASSSSVMLAAFSPDPPPPLSDETIAALTNKFCIEEVMRATQARYYASKLPVTNQFIVWPKRFFTNGVFIAAGESPGNYPPDGFYCADYEATNYFGPYGTRQSLLVSNLAARLADNGFLSNYVAVADIEGMETVPRYSVAQMPPPANITSNNYLDAMVTLVGYVQNLHTLLAGGRQAAVRVKLNGDSRTAPDCAGAEMCVRNRFEDENQAPWGKVSDSWNCHPPSVWPYGQTVIHSAEWTWKPTFENNVHASLSRGEGKIEMDLRHWNSTNHAAIYLKLSRGNISGLPIGGQSTFSTSTNKPVSAAENRYGSWRTVAVGVISSNDLVTAALDFQIHCPPNGAESSWKLTDAVALFWPTFTNNITGSCAGCAPRIRFTEPPNGTNLTACVGSPTNIENFVTLNGTFITNGIVTWTLNPADLGAFTTNNISLNTQGKAATIFIASSNAMSGTITASATQLKDANGIALPNVFTNLTVNLPSVNCVLDNLPEDQEEDPGAVLCVDTNGNHPRTPLDVILNPGGRSSGELKLEATPAGSDEITVWDASSGGNPVPMPWSFSISSTNVVTRNFFVQALKPGLIEFLSRYTVNPVCEDKAKGVRINIEFKARAGKINDGFDPTGEEPWTSVCANTVSDVVKLVIDPAVAADKIELMMVSGAQHADVTPKEFAAGTAEANLAIEGKAVPGNAVIGVRIKGTNKICAKLNVMVLPERTVRISIYRIHDNASPATKPVGGPNDQQILDKLNEIFKQGCVKFKINNSPVQEQNVHYDAPPKDGRLQASEITSFHLFNPNEGLPNLPQNANVPVDPRWKGPLNIFFVRRSGIPYPPPNQAHFVRAFSVSERHFSIVFTFDSGNATDLITAHEMGHLLGLTSRNPDDGGHDTGLKPDGTDLLMKPGTPVNNVPPPAPGVWLPWEDWRTSNAEAEQFQ